MKHYIIIFFGILLGISLLSLLAYIYYAIWYDWSDLMTKLLGTSITTLISSAIVLGLLIESDDDYYDY